MAGRIVRRHGKKKLVLTNAGMDLLIAKGEHTAVTLLMAALLNADCVTYSQLIHKLRWPTSELRDTTSATSKHLSMVSQAGKIDPASIVEVFSIMSVPLLDGYNLKTEQRVMTTADYVCGAAAYLNRLFRTGKLGGRDIWSEVQKESPSQAVLEALMLVVQPAMRDPQKSQVIMPESLQRNCQAYGLTLTGNCAVTLYDLLADELEALRQAELAQARQTVESEVAAVLVDEVSVVTEPLVEIVPASAVTEVATMSAVTEPTAEPTTETVEQLPTVISTTPVKAEIYRVVKAVLMELEATGWPPGKLDMNLLKGAVRLVQPNCLQPATVVSTMKGVFWGRVSRGLYQMRDVSVSIEVGQPKVVPVKVTPAQVRKLVTALKTGKFELEPEVESEVTTNPENTQEVFRRLLQGQVREQEQGLQQRQVELEQRERNLVKVQAAIDAALTRKAEMEADLVVWRVANEPLMTVAVEKLSHLRALLK